MMDFVNSFQLSRDVSKLINITEADRNTIYSVMCLEGRFIFSVICKREICCFCHSRVYS